MWLSHATVLIVLLPFTPTLLSYTMQRSGAAAIVFHRLIAVAFWLPLWYSGQHVWLPTKRSRIRFTTIGYWSMIEVVSYVYPFCLQDKLCRYYVLFTNCFSSLSNFSILLSGCIIKYSFINGYSSLWSHASIGHNNKRGCQS